MLIIIFHSIIGQNQINIGNMTDWDEIKRLAADFQRTQTSDTLQRISDRNCIDIVKKLTELNLIELIYTCDGKEFLTPSHLLKEIEDEIYVNGGRMHVHDLAANLNVDYQHIENMAKELAGTRPNEYSLILGQVIHSIYKTTLGKQISDCMLTNGQLSIADFAKNLDLPSDFLLSIVKEILPLVVDDFVASQDERTFYTTDMMDRYRSMIAGTLTAICKPTTIASLIKRLDIPERIFMPIVDSILKEGRIDATVENRLFIPAVYAREQNEYIDKFYSANSYIEYDLLSRRDIKQPKAFLKKKFPTGIALKTCFISPDLVSQVESLIEDSIVSNGWIDISTIVPSALESTDIEQIINDILKTHKQYNSSCVVINQVHVCSLGFIATCKESFKDLMQSKAFEHLRLGKLVNHFLGGKLKEPTKTVNEPLEQKEPIEESTEGQLESTKDDKNAARSNQDDQPQQSDKKERKDKKTKVEIADMEDSDEQQGSKKNKAKKSGSGGGTQGREIKQKKTKKKYNPNSKGDQGRHELSDDEPVPTKAPRSNKGRAARRGHSPEGPSHFETRSKGSQSNSGGQVQKEPLIFMTLEEIMDKLKIEARGSGECPDELFESIARLITNELNERYVSIAKQTLDEHLKAQADDENDPSKAGEVDIVE